MDFYSVFASFGFVYLYLTLHMQSLALSSFSMMLIIFSVPVTILIYKGLLGINYFSQLHMMIIFVILGISADDIFAIHDAWRQSETVIEFEGNYRKRMAYMFKRAGCATFITSLTTCAAFLANGFSEIMPIQAFGIFAAIIVMVNYILIALLLPPMININDKYLRGKICESKKSQ